MEVMVAISSKNSPAYKVNGITIIKRITLFAFSNAMARPAVSEGRRKNKR